MSDIKKPPYRTDIDGLRAIAVISVFLFHISFKLVPGGFAGVDIFFVISGFLITKIIGTEILAGQFSFKNFCLRRIRRILPVFLVVIVVTMIVGKILLLPDDLASLLESIKYALLFSANIYFSKERGYFDLASDEKPILHTWSLAIEEQYYLIWPLLLIIFYLVGSKVFNQRKTLHQSFALLSTFIFMVADFIWTQQSLALSESTTKLYFLLQTRFCELMIGSLAAMLPYYKNQIILNVLGLIGLLGIFLALFIINKNDLFPGYNALIPCGAAALLLYAGQAGYHQKCIAAKCLNLPILVYVGLLSYSIYLWHWPILAFMRYIYGRYALPLSWNIMAVLLTVTLSYLSYHFLEKKLKHSSMTFSKAFWGVYVAPVLCLMVLCFMGIYEAKAIPVNKILTTYGEDVCHGNFDKKCVRGDLAQKPRILMFGDSHAAALNSFIDVVGKKEHWSAKVLTASSCSPVFGFDEMALPKFAQQPCADLKKYVSQNYQKYDAIFIASYWAFQLGRTNFSADKNYFVKLKKTIEIMAKDRPVYVFSDVPDLPVSPFRAAHFRKLHLSVNRIRSKQYGAANEVVKNMVLSIPNAHWVDLATALENFDQYSVYHGLPTYLDDQHLNQYGSAQLGEIFCNSSDRIKLEFNHKLP